MLHEPLTDRRGIAEQQEQQEAAHRGRQHHGDGEERVDDSLPAALDTERLPSGEKAADEDDDKRDAACLERDPQRAVINGRKESAQALPPGGNGLGDNGGVRDEVTVVTQDGVGVVGLAIGAREGHIQAGLVALADGDVALDGDVAELHLLLADGYLHVAREAADERAALGSGFVKLSHHGHEGVDVTLVIGLETDRIGDVLRHHDKRVLADGKDDERLGVVDLVDVARTALVLAALVAALEVIDAQTVLVVNGRAFAQLLALAHARGRVSTSGARCDKYGGQDYNADNERGNKHRTYPRQALGAGRLIACGSRWHASLPRKCPSKRSAPTSQNTRASAHGCHLSPTGKAFTSPGPGSPRRP